MHNETVEILENSKVNSKYFKLVFSSKNISKNVLPGQFLNVQVEPATDPLLRRPFSYYRVKGAKTEVLYEIMGRGTEMLSQKNPGQSLQILGPLGKPFRLDIGTKKRILVAGGVGVPPMIFLGEYACDKKRTALLIGCKSKGEVLPPKELSKLKNIATYATDDGSYGTKGFVTVLLRKMLEKENPQSVFIQTCGPHPMMHAVIKIAKEFGVEGEASIDERMACGVGACLGCMVETHEGRKTSCVEGPVFSFSQLKI